MTLTLFALSLTACGNVAIDKPVTQEEVQWAGQLIPGQGWRCDEVTSMQHNAAGGYIVDCKATPKMGITTTNYNYVLMHGNRGWIAVANTPHSKI